MRDADQQPRNAWAAFLRDITDRPEWDVARLAREAGVHRSSIFRWLGAEGDGPKVTVDSVLKIARAAGVDESAALHAAAGLTDDAIDEDDESIRLIMASDASDEVKEELVREIRRMQRQAANERTTWAQRLLDMTRRVRGAT